MSTILKALRQLEHDKASSDADSDPLLDSALHEQSRPAHRRGRRPVWLGVGMTVAGLSLLVVAMYPTLTAWYGPEVPVVRAPAPAREAPVREAPAPAQGPVPVAQTAPPIQDASPVNPLAPVAEPIEDGVGPAPVAQVATVSVVAPPAVEAVAVPVPTEDPAPRVETNRVATSGEGDKPANSVAETVAASSPNPSPNPSPSPSSSPNPSARPAPAPTVVPVRAEQVPDALPAQRALAGQRPPKRGVAGVVLSNEDLTAARSDAVERAQELVGTASGSGAEPAPLPDELPPEREQLARADPPPPTLAVAESEPVVARASLAPPPLGLERTSWHPTPERREANVSIDGTSRLIRQGDTALGYRVVEITPSAVVFGRGEETVRVRVGAR